jgi:hypothetical protein
MEWVIPVHLGIHDFSFFFFDKKGLVLLGSLFTSIIPNLILQKVGEAIAEQKTLKILILNG